MAKATKSKKEVLYERKKIKGVLLGLVGSILVILFVGFVIFSGGGITFKEVRAEAGVVNIPLSEVEDGKAHYYTYISGNPSRKINFFVLQSSDGVIRTAFDACDVCFSEKKGYRQKGDFMVCNNCGQRFPSTKINELKGGCNPAPIEREIIGENLVIRADEIEKGKVYFP